MERAKDFPHIFLTPMNITLPLTTKISAGIIIKKHCWLLNHSKAQKIHLANCVKEGLNQHQRDCESAYNQNHLNRGNNFPTDQVKTASGFAPTC